MERGDSKRRKLKGQDEVLAFACVNGWTDVCNLILTNTNADASKALLVAVTNNCTKIVNKILTHDNVDVNITDKDKNTPLLLAIGWGKIKIAKLLLGREKIDVNATNYMGRTALIGAAWGGFLSVIDTLLCRKDTKINHKDHQSYSALGWAAKKDQYAAFQLLLSYGAVWNKGDGTTFTVDAKINEMLKNRKSYLRPWNRFTMAARYPQEFKKIAIIWLLCCKRMKVFPKDLQYLIVEYIARVWKQSWSREDVIKSLFYENECLKLNLK